jgi:hypothetical protein
MRLWRAALGQRFVLARAHLRMHGVIHGGVHLAIDPADLNQHIERLLPHPGVIAARRPADREF